MKSSSEQLPDPVDELAIPDRDQRMSRRASRPAERWRPGHYDHDRPDCATTSATVAARPAGFCRPIGVSGGRDDAESDARIGEEPFVARFRFAELALQVPTRHRESGQEGGECVIV